MNKKNKIIFIIFCGIIIFPELKAQTYNNIEQTMKSSRSLLFKLLKPPTYDDLEQSYNFAKEKDFIKFFLVPSDNRCSPKIVNKFLRKHPELHVVHYDLSAIPRHGMTVSAISGLIVSFDKNQYTHYPKKYNTLSKIESLKEGEIYDTKTHKYKKGRWTGSTNYKGRAEGQGIGFYGDELVYGRKYEKMITGELEDGKPKGNCILIEREFAPNRDETEIIAIYKSSVGNYNNGVKVGEFDIRYNWEVPIWGISNVKHIKAVYDSNENLVGTIRFYDSNEKLIDKGYIQDDGRILLASNSSFSGGSSSNFFTQLAESVAPLIGAGYIVKKVAEKVGDGITSTMQYMNKKAGVTSEDLRRERVTQENNTRYTSQKSSEQIVADRVIRDGVPRVKKEGSWSDRPAWSQFSKEAVITYRDGTIATLFYDNKKYYVESLFGLGIYSSKDDALKSLYYYKKVGKLISKEDLPKLMWK